MSAGGEDRFDRRLRSADPAFAVVVGRMPLQDRFPLPKDWLRCEVLERHLVLQCARVVPSTRVLEVGSGAHALATIPLAHAVGTNGRLLALERERWGQFGTLVRASGLAERVHPLRGDARQLPLRTDSVDLAVCVHGIRSLGSEEHMIEVFHEMLRASPRIFLSESLPIARSDAQRAHLAMYDLREEVFLETHGRRDDLHYLPLDRLVALAERAGGSVHGSGSLDVDLPHALAYFPRSLVEAIPPGGRREDLLRRWAEAEAMRERYGTDHPPVGWIEATRS